MKYRITVAHCHGQRSFVKETSSCRGARKTGTNQSRKVRALWRQHTSLNALDRSVLCKLSVKKGIMHIGRSPLLKLLLFAIVLLSIHKNDTNAEVTSPYGSHISTPIQIPDFDEERERSPDENRIDFQIRNHLGPGTYIFGFDTGHGKNRQYRMEERLRDGSVRGRYGFYDPKGKLRVVGYVAGPNTGYQERHHETIADKKPET